MQKVHNVGAAEGLSAACGRTVLALGIRFLQGASGAPGSVLPS